MTQYNYTQKAFLIISLLMLLTFQKGKGQCENRMIHFGTTIEYVQFQNIYPSNGDFTLEFWYNPAINPSAPCGEGLLFNIFSGLNSFFGMVYCNGNLEVFGANSCPTLTAILTGVGPIWHHLAITRQSGVTAIYFDGVSIYTTNCSYNIKDDIFLGSFGAATSGSTFNGAMDEIRFWNTSRTASQITQNMKCVVSVNDSDLQSYLRADQGDANDQVGNPTNNNSSITNLIDISGNNNHGDLKNFSLIGPTSNFICSTSPVIYPHFESLTPFISDYATQSSQIDSICSGEPLHICLKDSLGIPIIYTPQIDTIIWQYNSGNGWTNIASSFFDGFCFPIPSGEVAIDCDTSSIGLENWDIRAAIDIYNNLGDTCTYYTMSTKLKIFCDLQASLTGTTNYTNDLLCENDLVDFTMNITSPYSFIQTPVSGVQIDWFYTDAIGTYALTLYQNQTSILYNSVTVPAGQAYFTVGITDMRSGKKIVLRKYFQVDPKPVCGTIDLIPDPGTLTQLSSSPLIYEICPSEDAILQMTTPFSNCIPTWEYQLGNSFLWLPMGSTNTLQNTNIIPANFWPSGTTKLFFRIKCAPLNSPSGCDPCYSNVIEVRLSSSPVAPTILGQNYVCFGGSTTLSISNPSAALGYKWYCNGNSVGSGLSYSATTGGCYWVVASNTCHLVPSSKHCLDVCKITPNISCPLAPNACPAPGETIYLTGCASSSNCAGTLTYQWSWNNGSVVTINGCNLAHIPDPSGTTYTLTVTNTTTGCIASTSKTIVPCP